MEPILYHLNVFLNGLVYFLLILLGIVVFSFIGLYVLMAISHYIYSFFNKHPKLHRVVNKIESVLTVIVMIIVAIFLIYCVGLSALGINKISG